MKKMFVMCVILLLAVSSGFAGSDQEKDNNRKDEVISTQHKKAYAFTSEEIYVIQQYAQQKKQKYLPPGLEKKLERGGSLPPGWQMKLLRGEMMDEAVYLRCKPLPKEITGTIPKSDSELDTVLVEVEDKVVKMIEATRLIVDVFEL